MQKKRGPREPKEKVRVPDGGVEVIFRVSKGTILPKGPGSHKSSTCGKPRLSRGLTVEVERMAHFKLLAKERERSNPHSEFSRTWDELRNRNSRVRNAFNHLKKVCSEDVLVDIAQLAIDARVSGKYEEKLVWTFGGIGGSMTLGSEWGLDRLDALVVANASKAEATAELEHKVDLFRMDAPDAELTAIARYLLSETETDSDRCHDCQRHTRAVAEDRDVPRQPCELYQRYGRCKSCDVCRAWHRWQSKWIKNSKEKCHEDKSGRRVEVDPKERERKVVDALRKKIKRIDERVLERHTTT